MAGEDEIKRAIEAAWAELERQADEGGVYVSRDLEIVDGDIDMRALVEAILREKA